MVFLRFASLHLSVAEPSRNLCRWPGCHGRIQLSIGGNPVFLLTGHAGLLVTFARQLGRTPRPHQHKTTGQALASQGAKSPCNGSADALPDQPPPSCFATITALTDSPLLWRFCSSQWHHLNLLAIVCPFYVVGVIALADRKLLAFSARSAGLALPEPPHAYLRGGRPAVGPTSRQLYPMSFAKRREQHRKSLDLIGTWPDPGIGIRHPQQAIGVCMMSAAHPSGRRLTTTITAAIGRLLDRRRHPARQQALALFGRRGSVRTG